MIRGGGGKLKGKRNRRWSKIDLWYWRKRHPTSIFTYATFAISQSDVMENLYVSFSEVQDHTNWSVE